MSLLEDFYLHPFSNGFLQFTLGALFLLTVFHFLLFFQQKDKIYFLYSGYTFFIILSQINHLESGFLYDFWGSFSWIMDYPMLHTEIYYIIYVLFGLEFLGIKEQLPKWYRIIMTGLGVIIIYCVAVFLFYLFFDSRIEEVLLGGYYGFTLLMSALGLVAYIPFFKVATPLKYYLILGSFLLLFFSVLSLAIHQNLGKQNLPVEPSYSILYIGFLLENVLFSLGLGHKQKLILEEKNQSQEKLITQLQENDKLRIQVQKQLEASFKSMESQAEAEKVKSFKAAYDKELAELRLVALRSQMNPHFIFNSLNSIKSYIIENQRENAVYYLNKFAKLIRRILASTREKESSLAEELETMKLYVNIENLRFEHKIQFQVECEETLQTSLPQIKIPSLLLQPFLENAIWHGLSPSKNKMELVIKISTQNEFEVKIEIIDNGIGLGKGKKIKKSQLHKEDSFGIEISKERLKHFSKNFKSKGKIELIDASKIDPETTGTIVSIIIPVVPTIQVGQKTS